MMQYQYVAPLWLANHRHGKHWLQVAPPETNESETRKSCIMKLRVIAFIQKFRHKRLNKVNKVTRRSWHLQLLGEFE